MPGFKRLPNRYGTITKLSGKRRKPYCARKYVGESWDDESRKYNYKYVSVGTFATRKEALAALSKANEDDAFGKGRITFKAVADMCFAERSKTSSKSAQNIYSNALGWLKPIHDRTMEDLKTAELEAAVNREEVPRTTKRYCKSVINQVYEYALRHDLVSRDYSKLVRVNEDVTSKIKRIVFTPEEVAALKRKERNTIDDVVLTMLYSGFRISEALYLTKDNVDLEKRLFVNCGMKTAAGKNRTVPIHDDIYELIKHRTETAEKPSYFLFPNEGNKFLIGAFKYRFDRQYTTHTTHDCRHSFATYAYKCRMDATMVKLIMGHEVGDITKGRYTHITAEELIAEMKKYKIE